MNFPSFPGFAARLFATDDADFSLALVQAYNDWHIDEWCGTHPGRFIPMALPAIWDARTVRAGGSAGIEEGRALAHLHRKPLGAGLPELSQRPLESAVESTGETDTVMNVHIGSSGRLSIPSPDSPMDVLITLQPMNIVQAAADLLWSNPIKEFPDSEDRAVRRRHRVDPVFPRTYRSHLRHAFDVDQPGLQRQTAL